MPVLYILLKNQTLNYKIKRTPKFNFQIPNIFLSFVVQIKTHTQRPSPSPERAPATIALKGHEQKPRRGVSNNRPERAQASP